LVSNPGAATRAPAAAAVFRNVRREGWAGVSVTASILFSFSTDFLRESALRAGSLLACSLGPIGYRTQRSAAITNDCRKMEQTRRNFLGLDYVLSSVLRGEFQLGNNADLKAET
jgi:hypothetical protein